MENLIEVGELSELEDAMTKFDADELLEEYRQCEGRIKEAEAERDEFRALYETKIARAIDICEKLTVEERNKMAVITEKLRHFAEAHVTDKLRSVPLPTGLLAFRKQQPKFFFDDLKEATGKDARLIEFVKHNAYDFLKVKVDESVDWLRFKGKLGFDDEGNVFYKETGELINGLHAQTLPDKFTITLERTLNPK